MSESTNKRKQTKSSGHEINFRRMMHLQLGAMNLTDLRWLLAQPDAVRQAVIAILSQDEWKSNLRLEYIMRQPTLHSTNGLTMVGELGNQIVGVFITYANSCSGTCDVNAIWDASGLGHVPGRKPKYIAAISKLLFDQQFKVILGPDLKPSKGTNTINSGRVVFSRHWLCTNEGIPVLKQHFVLGQDVVLKVQIKIEWGSCLINRAKIKRIHFWLRNNRGQQSSFV